MKRSSYVICVNEMKMIFSFQVNDTLKLYVTIEDEVESMQDSNKVIGNGNNVVRADVTLIITDVNDNPPVFLDVRT